MEIDPALIVSCEAQDLDEMLGNLLDNACKWARNRVRVRAIEGNAHVDLRIEDDGPGLSAEQSAEVVRPGKRLDESAPGYGFGLPITRELAELYGGALTLDRSDLGGLQAVLRLPKTL